MSAKQQWVASYRFVRALKHVTIEQGLRQVRNGLYPSWLPREQYAQFLYWCRVSNEVIANRMAAVMWSEREHDSERIREIEDRLTWCEQTDMSDVKRHIRTIIADRYDRW